MARSRRVRLVGAVVLGVVGCSILAGLGTWQVQRHFWKQDLLAAMEARLTGAPAALPATPDPARDTFAAVLVTGAYTGPEVLVMTARRGSGAGYRVIAAFEGAEGRRLLIDRGYIPADARTDPRPPQPATVAGNLHWPDEIDRFTPAPDPAQGLWFARDVPAIAAHLGTEPVLVVLRDSDEGRPGALPQPLDTAGVPDNHRNYAITWFLLCAGWAGMTALLVWRIRRETA